MQNIRRSRSRRRAAPSQAAAKPRARGIRAFRSTDKEESINARLEGLTLLTANNRAAAQSALRAARRSARSGQCYDPIRHAALRRLVTAHCDAGADGGDKILPRPRPPAGGA
ncbi:hypothetical protein V5G24_07370 [Xanthobacter sp. VTT E-85241]|uniref:hypothetical protein n=1 Tax=Roseixanthobacter finlandensis TaxID=3119922 RepID=UPI00372CD55A